MKEEKFISIIKDLLPESKNMIGDDTAFIPNRDLILTQDTLIEDVHFRKSTISPFDLGIKSVAVNLSDIAASGGIAEYILISLSLPKNIEEEFVRELYKGINHICSKYGVIVAGGDITGADKINISISAIGRSENITPAKRSNAKPNDIIITTGNHGSSAAGLWLLENKNDITPEISEKIKKTHTAPTPQLELGRLIAKTCRPNPCIMDSSDGLADALYKIAVASNVSMEIDKNKIPYDKELENIATKANIDHFNWVFFGGEDYQLVASVSEESFKEIKNQCPIFVIGRVIESTQKPKIVVKSQNDTYEINKDSMEKMSFDHFGGKI